MWFYFSNLCSFIVACLSLEYRLFVFPPIVSLPYSFTKHLFSNHIALYNFRTLSKALFENASVLWPVPPHILHFSWAHFRAVISNSIGKLQNRLFVLHSFMFVSVIWWPCPLWKVILVWKWESLVFDSWRIFLIMQVILAVCQTADS